MCKFVRCWDILKGAVGLMSRSVPGLESKRKKVYIVITGVWRAYLRARLP